jgi:hypothetical protein
MTPFKGKLGGKEFLPWPLTSSLYIVHKTQPVKLFLRENDRYARNAVTDRRVKSRPPIPIPRLSEERLEVVPLVRMGAHGLGERIRISLGSGFNGLGPLPT